MDPQLDEIIPQSSKDSLGREGFDLGVALETDHAAKEAPVVDGPRWGKANQHMDQHAAMLVRELAWLKVVLNARIESYFNDSHALLSDFPAPALIADSRLGKLIEQHQLTAPQRIVLSIALATEVQLDLLDILQTKNSLYDLPYAEFGGVLNQNQGGFSPSLQTATFILAGADCYQTLQAKQLLSADGVLFRQDILRQDSANTDTNSNQIPLKLNTHCRDHLLFGRDINPEYCPDFPAKALTTDQDWQDLVLPQSTESHLQDLMLWLKHHRTLNNDWGSHSAGTGYKALFYGPPGTGKTFTASLLAKRLALPIYRIDLSQIVSKFIGETEKNLEKIFLRAENQQWILFFDEADALFSKRSGVSNSNDRHANQETAYLLQRIESCQNLVILASNLKENIDEAFLRRFQSIVHFPRPEPAQRLDLWRKGFSPQADISHVDLDDLSAKYRLTGAEINSVIRYASLKAIDRNSTVIEMRDLVTAIKREKSKQGVYTNAAQ
ncbi:MAG: AAA family ATPase [Gammaproteobacteria bacterium]|nr:MAG: AAA family ATPase [Gammaproteobacteria bacterium]